MISAGQNIRAVDDPLQRVRLDYFYQSIRNPRPEVAAKIRQLRIIQSMDSDQYKRLKCELPYVVCGSFVSGIRRSEQFAYSDYFILDIDHISEKGISISDLRSRIEADSRVVLCFLSPSQDGLKVFFRFKERCMDKELYAIFYKAFAISFAKQYMLEQVIDQRTCDVTRACFVSEDADAYYNENAERVDLNQFVDTSNVFELFSKKKEVEAEQKTMSRSTPSDEVRPVDPSKEVMDKIRGVLNPSALKKMDKHLVVPEILNALKDDLRKFLEELQIQVVSMKDINYGKQIFAKVGIRTAEVNLFYGKKGFSVVRTTKSGTDEELSEMLRQLVEQFIAQKQALPY